MLSYFKKAFPRTLPVLAGYIFLGIAYGISMAENGFGVAWAAFISVAVFAGSLQFAMIAQMAAPFSPVTMALVALFVNARHIFYGISMLDKYRGTGKYKPYLIFAMSDETYSLTVQGAPEGVDKGKWFFAISLMDQSYWVIGTLIGSLTGAMLNKLGLMEWINGIDFAMTTLFTVIVTEQAMAAVKRIKQGENAFDALFPAMLGFAATLISLLAIGKSSFLILAMGLMLCAFTGKWFVRR